MKWSRRTWPASQQVNGHLNAVVRLLTDEALLAADQADAAVAAGGPLGRLHGVPCTVKENIDVAGTPTTDGVPMLADSIAAIDAPTVERMRAAGAIPFARTNLPDFGLRVHTDSSLHGLTRNPWNPNVTAGGSSGGEGSAISSGMSPIGLGNDIGGSLRNPAHCCGIASIKPTIGVVPMASINPPEDKLLSSQLMLAEGPMARHVADVRAGLEILAGQHWRDPRSVSAVLTDAEPGERLTIAVLADPPGGKTDAGIEASVRGIGDRLSDEGHNVVEVTPPEYERVIELWMAILIADLRAQHDLLALVMGPDGQAIITDFDSRVPPTEFPIGDDAPRRSISDHAALVGLLPGPSDPAHADVGATRVRPRGRHRRDGERDRPRRHDPTGDARQRPRYPGCGRAHRRLRRSPRRRPGDG